METDTLPRPKAHHGRNIKRLRDVIGIKQETLADKLNLSQQTVSRLEDKEQIDDETLAKVAEILRVPIEAIKNMTDETTINYINTFNDSAVNQGQNYYPTFNPIDKIVELYERLLEIERNNKK